ncbi:hypothetical protein K470DRAFT_258836 [Piedraia hortae CBS 480.64]|uniref:Mid2 domain-containing protein n=1 Tax=Piedraia hortae CBS 480.64 TaxID=1314780 RepID=A0A6A7BWA8_9PEZI|nr:hypothetical protein K470DRAFT_258836 [Piedraia hortae CBS 480.64]
MGPELPHTTLVTVQVLQGPSTRVTHVLTATPTYEVVSTLSHQTASSKISMSTGSPTPDRTNPPSDKNGRQTAIAGGVVGSVAGLLLLTSLTVFFMRRRRRGRHEKLPRRGSEKGTMEVVRKQPRDEPHRAHRDEVPDEPLNSHRNEPCPIPRTTSGAGYSPPTRSFVTVDEEHHKIFLNTQHWERPFAQGHGEGIRDSWGPGQLRVVNPDPLSRPATRRMSTETLASFLRKQRTNINAIIFASGNASRASLRHDPHAYVHRSSTATLVPDMQEVDITPSSPPQMTIPKPAMIAPDPLRDKILPPSPTITLTSPTISMSSPPYSRRSTQQYSTPLDLSKFNVEMYEGT